MDKIMSETERIERAKQEISVRVNVPVSEMVAMPLPDGRVMVRGKPFERYRQSEWD